MFVRNAVSVLLWDSPSQQQWQLRPECDFRPNLKCTQVGMAPATPLHSVLHRAANVSAGGSTLVVRAFISYPASEFINAGLTDLEVSAIPVLIVEL